MDIKNAQFSLSSPSVAHCPTDVKPEFAFIGRSNVGKSSLINMLCNHKGLAKTSSTPGKTLLINHFIINNEWYLVDLPGYGYAKRSKTVQDRLDQMIRSYILMRQQLVNVFVLIDIRLEQQKIDREFIDWLGESSIPFSIVFTKADKARTGEGKDERQGVDGQVARYVGDPAAILHHVVGEEDRTRRGAQLHRRHPQGSEMTGTLNPCNLISK